MGRRATLDGADGRGGRTRAVRTSGLVRCGDGAHALEWCEAVRIDRVKRVPKPQQLHHPRGAVTAQRRLRVDSGARDGGKGRGGSKKRGKH
jgi:hypothetical protein